MRRSDDARINVHLTGRICTVAALIAIFMPISQAIAIAHPWTKIAAPLVLVSALGVAARSRVSAIALCSVLICMTVTILFAGLRDFHSALFSLQILGGALMMWPVVVLYRNRYALR